MLVCVVVLQQIKFKKKKKKIKNIFSKKSLVQNRWGKMGDIKKYKK